MRKLLPLVLLACGCYNGPPRTTPSPSAAGTTREGMQPGFLYWLIPTGSAASECQGGALATSRGVTAGDVALGFLTAFLFTPTHSGAVCAQPGQSAYIAPVDTEAVIAAAVLPGAPYGQVVECQVGDDCKTKWDRAQLWLSRHGAMKIQLATDAVIETYNPAGAADLGYGFTASKEQIDAQHSRISLAPACRAAEFGVPCTPRAESVRRAFGYYVATGGDLLANTPATSGIR